VNERDLFVKFPRMWHHAMILLLLMDKPSHGYELFERMSEFGCKVTGIGPKGNLYRFLQELEEQSLVSCSWQHPGNGPGRKIYHITPAGIRKIKKLQNDLRRVQSRIEHFMHRSEDLIEERLAEKGPNSKKLH